MTAENKGKRILVVDDDPENVELLSEYLAKEGHNVTSAPDGETALHKLKAWKPHLILLDVNMPGISGLELVPKIRAATVDDYVTVMLVSANMSLDDVNKGLNAGADDYLTKPFRAQDLLPRVKCMIRLKELHDNLRRATHRAEELSVLDDLTGLLNMRALFRRGDEEISRARRFQKTASVLLVNIDGFVEVNDRHGFQFGSQVIKAVGGQIKQCIRSIDLLGRVGADEYLVVLPETDIAGAEFAAERIREAVQAFEIKSDKHTAKVTVGVGIAGLSKDKVETSIADLYRLANEALKTAKNAGTNRTEIYSFG